MALTATVTAGPLVPISEGEFVVAFELVLSDDATGKQGFTKSYSQRYRQSFDQVDQIREKLRLAMQTDIDRYKAGSVLEDTAVYANIGTVIAASLNLT